MRHDGPGYRRPTPVDPLDRIRQEALEHAIRMRAERERLMRLAEVQRRQQEAARAERERRDKGSAH